MWTVFIMSGFTGYELLYQTVEIKLRSRPKIMRETSKNNENSEVTEERCISSY